MDLKNTTRSKATEKVCLFIYFELKQLSLVLVIIDLKKKKTVVDFI